MYDIKRGIKEGLKHRKCLNCNNELSIILGGLFGEKYEEVKKSEIKYISGCCFNSEYYFCDKCKKYFDKKLPQALNLRENCIRRKMR